MNLIYWVRANRLGQKLDDEKGLVLIAVLCLLAALVLVGTTAFIVSSSNTGTRILSASAMSALNESST